ncbi:hypothetical protein ACFZAR_41405 [Streptomyces sp. NPDC008222]|uniref:hypothetical protein n=1 Tax=Streptomyces sp. NPDC008222 TaxID=3364820 RepID=UPI0036E4E8C3
MCRIRPAGALGTEMAGEIGALEAQLDAVGFRVALSHYKQAVDSSTTTTTGPVTVLSARIARVGHLGQSLQQARDLLGHGPGMLASAGTVFHSDYGASRTP